MDLAADHLVDRQVCLLADNIPARQFDKRQPGHHDFAGGAEIEQRESAVEVFDVIRVVPDDMPAHVLQVLQDGVRLPKDSRLADAMQAVAGLEYKVSQVSPGRSDDECRIVGYFHRWGSAFVSSRGDGGFVRLYRKVGV